MQDYDLKNPGDDQLAQTTRRNVAKLLSNVDTETNPSPAVAAFLLDAATKAPGYVPPAAEPLPGTQAIAENGKPVTVRAGSANVVSQFSVVSGVISVNLPATSAVVPATITLAGKKYTFTVAGSAITAITVEDAA